MTEASRHTMDAKRIEAPGAGQKRSRHTTEPGVSAASSVSQPSASDTAKNRDPELAGTRLGESAALVRQFAREEKARISARRRMEAPAPERATPPDDDAMAPMRNSISTARAKNDCNTKYSNLGPLAVPLLLLDATRQDGCHWQ